MKLIMLYGPPAAGKLTVGQEIVKQSQTKKISCKEFKIFDNSATIKIIEPIIPFGEPGFFKLNGQYRLLMYETCAKNDINLVTTLVYAHNEDSEWINKINTQLKKFDAEIYYIQILASDATLLSRINNESRHNQPKLKDAKILKELFTKYDLITPINDTYKTYSSDDMSAKEIAEDILHKLCT